VDGISDLTGVYVLIATERIHRAAADLGGATLVLGLGIVSSDETFNSSQTGIDWDAVLLLMGMMLVVGVIRRTGVFPSLAIRSAKVARGRPYRVLVPLVLVTAGASALLDNVRTSCWSRRQRCSYATGSGSTRSPSS
jgi:Na+/H+ antiporter NhaD/arsenite permease-like protein